MIGYEVTIACICMVYNKVLSFCFALLCTFLNIL